jgi:hypothetical protein
MRAKRYPHEACAITPISMARQWRNRVCAINKKRPREKHGANAVRHSFSSSGALMAQWRRTPRLFLNPHDDQNQYRPPSTS